MAQDAIESCLINIGVSTGVIGQEIVLDSIDVTYFDEEEIMTEVQKILDTANSSGKTGDKQYTLDDVISINDASGDIPDDIAEQFYPELWKEYIDGVNDFCRKGGNNHTANVCRLYYEKVYGMNYNKNNIGELSQFFEDAYDNFEGSYSSEEEWAEEYLNAIGDIPKYLENYIDYEAFAGDAHVDYTFVDDDETGEVHVFRN